MALVAALLVGCHSSRPITVPVASHLPTDPHAEVRVTAKSGAETRLVETRVERDSLIGRNVVTGDARQAFALADLANLQVDERDTGKTALLIVGGAVVVGIVALGLAIAALSSAIN